MRFVRRLYVEFHAEASLGMFNGFGKGMRLFNVADSIRITVEHGWYS